MSKRDYYEVLGVERSATVVEIKKSYKRLALELHPDRNPGNAEAEERFKEASEAFQVLNDQEKRSLYDRYGHQGLQGRGAGFGNVDDIFSSFQDIFGDLFGFSGRGQRRDGPMRGADLKAAVQLTLVEAAFGAQKEVTLNFPAPCGECDGSGAEGGRTQTCSTCKGAGQVAHARGAFLLSSTCPSCHGAGRIAVKGCASCQGRGEVAIERKVKVAIPSGIDEGQSLRLANQGQPGRKGGPAGHLYVVPQIEPDDRFQRDGDELLHELHVPFTHAALGGRVRVPTLEGETDVDLPAGIQPGEQVRVRGQGVPRLNGRGRGDLVCLVQVDVPKKLSAKARKLLLELQETFETDR